MPAFAFLMLLIWPLVSVVLFSRMDRQRAVVWTILGGYLLLPPLIQIDLPLFPGINKAIIPALSAALILYATRDVQDPLPKPPPLGAIITLLVVMNFTSPIFTAMTNGDPLYDEINFRPAMTAVMAVGDVLLTAAELLPFWLGYRLLWNQRGAELLLAALVTGILFYSAFMLFELRFSPQSNIILYGYFQHDFIQTVRYGGYRPIVFLEHPLWVALLTMWAFVSAVALTRIEPVGRNRATVLYLGVLTLLCKSAGALLQALIAAPIVALARPRLMVLIAAMIASLAFAYPTLRATPWMPLQGIVDTATAISPERGQSLEFRLRNEERLVERARERPLFGWGGWGRSLFYDPYNGRISSVPDGQWVIWMGSRGIYGYLAQFLLLLVPIWMMLRAVPGGKGGAAQREYVILGCLSLILAMNCLDLLPNATLTPVTWLAAGTLFGNARRLMAGSPSPKPTALDILPKKAGIETVL